MWPDDECVVHISIPAGRLVCGFFYISIWSALLLQSLRDTYKRALETGTCVGRAPSGEHGGEAPLLGTFVRKVRFYSSQDPLFTRDCERCVKEGSGNMHLTAQGSCQVSSSTWDF